MNQQNPTTENEPSKLKRFFDGCNSALPTANLIGIIVLAVAGYIWTQNSSAITQAQEIRESKENIKQIQQRIEERKNENDKQIDELKKTVMTRELFEAYHKNDSERMTRMEKMVERILENQVR